MRIKAELVGASCRPTIFGQDRIHRVIKKNKQNEHFKLIWLNSNHNDNNNDGKKKKNGANPGLPQC